MQNVLYTYSTANIHAVSASVYTRIAVVLFIRGGQLVQTPPHLIRATASAGRQSNRAAAQDQSPTSSLISQDF